MQLEFFGSKKLICLERQKNIDTRAKPDCSITIIPSSQSHIVDNYKKNKFLFKFYH